jgi:hypothetical protein
MLIVIDALQAIFVFVFLFFMQTPFCEAAVAKSTVMLHHLTAYPTVPLSGDACSAQSVHLKKGL